MLAAALAASLFAALWALSVAAQRPTVDVVVTYVAGPTAQDRVQRIDAFPNVAGVYANESLEMFLSSSRELIGAELVHTELGITGAGVAIAVVDTGINTDHPDLPLGEDKVVENHRFQAALTEADVGPVKLVVLHENETDSDNFGHGTHVAGIAGGLGAGDPDLAGIAPGADLVGPGTGDWFIFWALAAFDWVLGNHERLGIRIVTNSWGSTRTCDAFDPAHPINVATQIMVEERGLVVTFAAGNAGPKRDTLNHYAMAPWTIGVAASTKDDPPVLANFSSRGVMEFPDDRECQPTLTAPGVSIIAARDETSFLGGLVTDPSDPNSDYMAISGTSMATPHVAGVVALMLEANPGLTPADVRAILIVTADEMFTPDGEPYEAFEVGAGFLDADEAVLEAEALASTAPPTPSVVGRP